MSELRLVDQWRWSATADAAPVVFEVAFDEPITSFTAADVTVTGTAGATTATVTGEGTTYPVSVDTIPNDGTVIIDIATGAVTDLAGNHSQASVVIANTVTVQAPPTTTTTIPDPTGVLPETGNDPLMAALAALFLVAGLGLLAASRRRTI